MTTFAPGTPATDLVPGDVEAVAELAATLDAYSDDASLAGTSINQLDAGAWIGKAAAAFRGAIGEIPSRLSTGAAAMGLGADALRSYAEALGEAQSMAGVAIDLAAQADALTASWESERASFAAAQEAPGGPRAAASPPASSDPGAALRERALGMLADARELVTDAANRSAYQLEMAGEDAPNEPSFLQKLWEGGKDLLGNLLARGADLAGFVFEFAPALVLGNPLHFASPWSPRTGMRRCRIPFPGLPTEWGPWLAGCLDRAKSRPPDRRRVPLDEILVEYQVEADTGRRVLTPFYGEPLTAAEERLLLQLVARRGLAGLVKFRELRDEARRTAGARYGDVGDRSHGNAFQHAYWNALMTREFGETFARKFATAHEAMPGIGRAQEAMDLYNNEVGREIAQSDPGATPEELADEVDEAVLSGELVVVAENGDLAYANNVPLGHYQTEDPGDELPGRVEAESR